MTIRSLVLYRFVSFMIGATLVAALVGVGAIVVCIRDHGWSADPAPDRIELVTMAEDGSFHRVTLVESGVVMFIVVDGRVMLLPTPPAPSEPSTPGVPWLFFSAPVIPGRRRSAACRAMTQLWRKALHLPRPRSTL